MVIAAARQCFCYATPSAFYAYPWACELWGHVGTGATRSKGRAPAPQVPCELLAAGCSGIVHILPPK